MQVFDFQNGNSGPQAAEMSLPFFQKP